MIPSIYTNMSFTNLPVRTFASSTTVNSDNKYFTQFTQNPVNYPSFESQYRPSNYYTSYADTRNEIDYSSYLYSDTMSKKNLNEMFQKKEPKYLDDNELIEKTAQLINKQHRMKMLKAQKEQHIQNQAPSEYVDKLKQLQAQVEQLQNELKRKQEEQELLQKQIQHHLIQTNFYSSNPVLEMSKQNLKNQQDEIRMNLEQKINQYNLHQQQVNKQYVQNTPLIQVNQINNYSSPRSVSYEKNKSYTVYERTSSTVQKIRSSSHAPALESPRSDDYRMSRVDQFYKTQDHDTISQEYKRVMDNLIKTESKSRMNSISSINLTEHERPIYDKNLNMTYAAQPSEKIYSEPRKITLNNRHGYYLFPSKTEKSLEIRVDDMFEKQVWDLQIKRRLEEEKGVYEKKLLEAKQMEEKLKREQELREKEALEQKLKEKEKVELELREQQMKEKIRREQEQREKELLEQKLKEKETIEKQLLEHQMKEKLRVEQEAKEREILERRLKEQEIQSNRLREQQKREQENLEKQLREKELIEKQLREQQVKEIEEKEALAKRLREKEMLEQKKKEQIKMKEKLKKEKKLKQKQQENKIQINIQDFKRLEFDNENAIFFSMPRDDSEVPSLNENEIEIKDFNERLPKSYSHEFNVRRKFLSMFEDEEPQNEESLEDNLESIVQEIKSNQAPANGMNHKLSSLMSSNVEVILEEEEEEAEREYREMMAYSKSNTFNNFGHTRARSIQNGYSSEGHEDDDDEN